MAKYHVSTDGNPRVCTAAEGNCPIGGDENHYTSKEAARAAFEAAAEAPESSSKKNNPGKSVRTVNERGDVEWRNVNGELHRDGDLPAIEYADGSKAWYQNGLLHRDGDQPAIEDADGSKWWYQNGRYHRDGDLPAIEWADGQKERWVNGLLHRDGGLPAAEWPNGKKEWWVNGEFQYRILPDGTRTNRLSERRRT